MEDSDVLADPATHHSISAALRILEKHLSPSYREADKRALCRQREHRHLAKSCIIAGVFAIILAILQLALQQIFKPLTTAAMLAEAAVIVFAAAAVAFGLVARRNHDWLVQRHRAERLRSLKFECLARPELANGQLAAWEIWVIARRDQILATESLAQVVDWAASLPVEPPFHEGAAPAADDLAFGRQLAAYYAGKRVGYQAAYFARRQHECHHQAGHWPHRGSWFFFGSVFCVVVHVGIDLWLHGRGGDHAVLHGIAVSLLALAAILPVIGFGVRAWFAAFEVPRSANLFGAKAKALADVARSLVAKPDDLPITLRHIAVTEHFLQHEHGEWIRLIRDTEWFL
jgi:hypothetical protein